MAFITVGQKNSTPIELYYGDADRILPITLTGLRTAKMIKGARLVVEEGGPHCIIGPTRRK